MDRHTAAYLPLTLEAMAAHLVGDVFMGLYPLLTDNRCYFLAADFDGSQLDIPAQLYELRRDVVGAPCPRAWPSRSPRTTRC